MIYLIDKDLWRDGKETEVRTEVGDIAIRLEQSSSIFSKKIIIYDRYHVEIGAIKKNGFSKHGYDIYYDNQVIGTILKKRVLLSKRLVIRSAATGAEFRIKGSMDNYTIDIYRKLRRVARAHPKLTDDMSKYGFECIDDEHRYLLLCSVIALGLG